MAKTNEKSGDKTSAAIAATPAATATAGETDRKRFSIYSRGADGKKTGDAIAVSDSPHTAYHFRNKGKCVIDHHNGDREYDGTNPAAAKK
jgi:hypothetical protein